MFWERVLGLALAGALLLIWSVYCRRLALAERADAPERRAGRTD